MKRFAFSLIELLIVVVIMGLVYTLGITNIQKATDTTSQLTLERLKSYLQSFPHQKDVLFLCLDDCQECRVIVDGKLDENTTKVEDFIDNSVQVYKYNSLSGMQQRDERVFFNSEDVEESVCFSYKIDSQGIGDQIYVEYRDSVYDFTPYNSVVKYDSLQDAQEHIEQIKQKVQR